MFVGNILTACSQLHTANTTCPSLPSQHQLISHATSILIGCDADANAVICLLSVGQLEDAVALCSKKIRAQKDDARKNNAIKASHFFAATVEKAKLLTTTGDKCKMFYHLSCFLRQTFPNAFTKEVRKIKVTRRFSGGYRASFTGDNETIAIEQSNLAHECKFPDDLFGGSNSALCMKVRDMFGYFNYGNVK